MNIPTRSQKLAQAAYARFRKEYGPFAKTFPALIHTCGLAQAVAFALAKKHTDYITDLSEVLKAGGHQEITDSESLDHHTRTLPLSGYLRLSRDAIDAASWLKRYVEAAEEGE